jgi:hypothetical protein
VKNRYLLFAIPVLFLLGLGIGTFTGADKHSPDRPVRPQDAHVSAVDVLPAPEGAVDESETAFFDDPADAASTPPHPTGAPSANSGSTSKPPASAGSGSGSTGPGSAGSGSAGSGSTGSGTDGGSSGTSGSEPPGHPGTGAPSKCPRSNPDSTNP